MLLPVVALLSLLLSWLASPPPASAHAKLLRTVPAAGTLVAEPPAEVQLYFNEAVGLEFSTITILNRARQEQPVGALGRVGGDETTASVPVTGALPDGTYTVVWRVLSVVDGHLIAGSFAFRVRAGTSTPTAGTPEPEEPIVPDVAALPAGNSFEGTSPAPDPIRWLARALILAAAIVLVGGPSTLR